MARATSHALWPKRFLELREEGVPLTEMAVLFRASFHSFDLEIELSKRNLPFVKRGGFKFIESTHIKDVLAHLRDHWLIPQDAVSWFRVLLLLEGVGPKSSDKILNHVLGGADQVQRLAEYPGRGVVKTEVQKLADALQSAADLQPPAERADRPNRAILFADSQRELSR